MAPSSEQREVIAFLSRPESYGSGVRTVESRRTHGAIVFLAGERAYKLKRAVRFPYMDYSTAERRRQMCEREFAINRRTAPMLYLGVTPIVGDGGALRFGTEDEKGAALDWVVVMRRFAQEDLLLEMGRAGKLTRALMRTLAEEITAFHRGAQVQREFGGAAGIRAVIEDNAKILAARAGNPFETESTAELAERTRAAFTRVAELLERRKEAGCVRRCHGDLHLNNIYLEGGRPVLFDAIEFSDQIACIDVLYDLAFLLMDLDRMGLRAQASAVFNRYLEVTGEHGGLAALPLFLSCRAAIRAHVGAAAADAALREGRMDVGNQEALAFADLARSYLSPPAPRLIAVGGVSGTGKSTLAYNLAPFAGAVPGAVVIRSDVIRKQLMGAEETARLPAEAYVAQVSEQVYRRMMALAAETLAAGHAAIVDGVFGRAIDRARVAEAARKAAARFDGVWLTAPEEVLRRRILGRRDDASDATIAVLRAQLGSVEEPADWLQVDAGLPEEEAKDEACRALGIAESGGQT